MQRAIWIIIFFMIIAIGYYWTVVDNNRIEKMLQLTQNDQELTGDVNSTLEVHDRLEKKWIGTSKHVQTLQNETHAHYKLYSETDPSYSYNQFEYEFNLSLCMFPFFVCVWFNSEEIDKLIDSTFPLRFLRNLDKYYQYYLKDFNIKKTKI